MSHCRREVRYRKCSKKSLDDLDARKIKAFKATVKSLHTCDLNAKEYFLNGTSLNDYISNDANVSGYTASFDDVSCNVDDFLGCYTPVLPEDSPINRTVFQYLLETAKEHIYGPKGLQERLDAGRQRLGLEISPGVQLVGSITFPNILPSDEGVTDRVSFLTAINWNLEAANILEYGSKPNPLVLSTLVHIGWIDQKTGQAQEKVISVNNQQFGPTIDYKFDPDFLDVESWGIKFRGQTTVDSELLREIGETGTIQVLLFRESGLRLYFPNEAGTCANEFPECRANTTVIQCNNNCSIGVIQSNNVSTSYGIDA
jgi:hypothetical protein